MPRERTPMRRGLSKREKRGGALPYLEKMIFT
jgi:hypothetical protein